MKELIRDYIVDNFGLHNTHFFKTPLMDIFIIPKGVDCAFIYMALVYMKKRGFDEKRLSDYWKEIENNWEKITTYNFLKNI